MGGSPGTPGEGTAIEVTGLVLFCCTLLTLISFNGRIALEIALFISVLKVSLSFPYGHDYTHPPFDSILLERRKAAGVGGGS